MGGLVASDARECALALGAANLGYGDLEPAIASGNNSRAGAISALGVELVGVEEYLSGLTDAVPPWMLGAAAIAVLWGLLQRQTRRVTIPGLLMVLPSVLANILPQARDPLFPSSNLIPVLIVVGAAPALFLGRAVIIEYWEHNSGGCAWNLCVTAVFVHHETLPSLPDLTRSTAFAELQQVLDELPEDSQIATYETAPALFQSGRQWNQWPSPFESRVSDWVLVSSLDDKVWEEES